MEEGAGDREEGREEKRGEGDKKEGFFSFFFQIGLGIEMRQSVGRIRSVVTLYFSIPPIGGKRGFPIHIKMRRCRIWLILTNSF